MADRMTPSQRSKCMSRIRSRNTGPEMTVRRELYHRGFRYRLNRKDLPGTPDIVLHKYHTVIFVNGCFWHGHEGCTKYVRPSSNVSFWEAKVKANRSRDAKVTAHLEALGWYVITVWECELSPSRFLSTMDEVEASLRANRFRFLSDKASEKRRREAGSILRKRKRADVLSKEKSSLSGRRIPKTVRSLSDSSEE
ncbi:MAG: very short patch repair endonuclease [Bacteroidales bacterium]|nr:very short patch repair endonuclease [Bacteroidales bacterium]